MPCSSAEYIKIATLESRHVFDKFITIPFSGASRDLIMAPLIEYVKWDDNTALDC